MTTEEHIVAILKELTPAEVMDITGLSEDTENLVFALSEYIEDNQDNIEQSLIAFGLLEEESD